MYLRKDFMHFNGGNRLDQCDFLFYFVTKLTIPFTYSGLRNLLNNVCSSLNVLNVLDVCVKDFE